MKWLFALVLSFQIIPAFAQYTFTVGEEIRIQESIYRKLLDGSGSSCQLQFLSTVKVEKIKADEIIVRYFSDRLEHPSNCANNIQLSFEPHYLDTHRDYFHAYQDKKLALTKIKSGISIQSMSGMSAGDEYNIPEWRWAVVEEAIGKFREGDLCRVWDPGYLKVQGFYEAKNSALFIYKNSGNDNRECPEDTLFFEKI